MTCDLDVVIGDSQANVVVVAGGFAVRGAADRKDTLHSQLIHRELVGVDDSSMSARRWREGEKKSQTDHLPQHWYIFNLVFLESSRQRTLTSLPLFYPY